MKTEKKKNMIHIIDILDRFSKVKTPPCIHPATHRELHIDAQEYQTNSGFLKALLKRALLR